MCPNCGTELSRVDSYADANEFRVEYCCPNCDADVVEHFTCTPTGFYYDHKQVKPLDPEKSTIADLLKFLRSTERKITADNPECDKLCDVQADYVDGYALGFVADLVDGAVEMSKEIALK